MIKGDKVELVPAGFSDMQRVYDWCFHSETTKSHAGPPDYPEHPIATWEEFFDEGYMEYFFTGAQPESGRGFMIVHGGLHQLYVVPFEAGQSRTGHLDEQ